MKQGVFISFEGNDGSGKTTIAKAVNERLQQLGYSTIYTREPGGSKIAENIRDVLLDVNNTQMDDRTEALLYAASRAQHLKEIIIPALEAKKIVICDRFIDSSLAYQGHARGLGIDEVWDINQFATNGLMPIKTLFFKVSIETGKKRMEMRGELNRLDKEAGSFHKKVREGYEILAKRYPDRIEIIDAEPAVEVVLENALAKVLEVIKEYE